VERTKFVARYGATPLFWFAKIISPVIIIGDTVAKWTLRMFGVEMTGAWLETEADRVESRADLRHRLDALLANSDVTDERRDEIVNALRVGDEPIRAVMTPREDIVFVETTVSPAENLSRIGESPHTRFPLVGESPSDFRGIIYAPSVIAHYEALRTGDRPFVDVAADPFSLDADTPISEAVDAFQDAHQELALVVDGPTNDVVGLITATDALEAIVGEIEDPLDLERV
jgi:CBS domain containing-hemolysin-like protein